MVIEDWSHFVSFHANVSRPTSHSELKKVLAEHRRDDAAASVRVLGGLHSCSRICESDTVISTEDMPYTIEFNEDCTLVTVSTNWHLIDFLLELSKRDRSLTATGGTNAQTLSGLISTNTAPATPKYGMYEGLEWVEFLTFNDEGDVVDKLVTKNEPEFRSVVCSLGALGILTRVQFRIVEQRYFETIQKIIPIKDVLDDVAITSKRYDFWRINWLQNSKKGLLWAATEIPRDAADPQGDYGTAKLEHVLKIALLVLAKLGNGGPLLDSVFKRLINWLLRKLHRETRVTGPLQNMLPVDRRTPLRVAMAEWFFDPVDLQQVLEQCRTYFRKNRWANLPIEIELSKGDRYMMSPLNMHGLECLVKFNFQYMTDTCTENEKEEIYEHLRGLWNHLLEAGVRFKAHWGKINFMDYEFVRTNYELDRFREFIRPDFLNSYLTRRLIPPVNDS